MGFEIIDAKFAFLYKIILFSSNSTVLNVVISQMLRSIEFPSVRFIRGLMITSKVYSNILGAISYCCCSYEYF